MHSRLIIMFFALVTLFSWIHPTAAISSTENKSAENKSATIQELMELIQKHHLSDTNSDVLTEGAIRGVLESLNDPYAEYFNNQELKGFSDTLNGNLVGVGIEISAGDKYPFVVGVIPGTPAEKGGITAGDIIVAVDKVRTFERQLNEVVNMIRGPRGSQVVLTIKRGEDEFKIDLQRAAIHVPLVEHEMLAEHTGYVKLNSFGLKTNQEFKSAIQNLQEDGMESLIIDLRNNGGGYLHEAVDILDNFIDRGSLLVSVVDKGGHREEIYADQDPKIKGLPMVVLVNGMSASASEIMAGVLQEYDLAILVGDTTFGKGVVQSIIPLSTGGAVKLTVSKYLTPEDNDIDLVGLRPDQSVLIANFQKEVAWQILHPQDNPDMVFVLDAGEIMLNGRNVEMNINILKRGSKDYLTMLPILEAMLYQVTWQDEKIEILSGWGDVPTINSFSVGQGSEDDIYEENGISYISVEMLDRLNINVNKDGNKFTISRRLQ